MDRSRRLVLVVLLAALALLVVADFFVEHHASFGIDGWPGFAAGFALLSAAIAVVVAYGWGLLMRRPGERADD